MAQPLFQQHPLQTYFRDVGEAADTMPGGLPEFPLHFDGDCDAPRSASDDDDEETDLNWVSSPIIAVLDLLCTLLDAPHMSSQTSSFIERFKYDVISSSLLSSSISAPHPIGQRSTSPAIPGRLSPIPDSENYTVDQPPGRSSSGLPLQESSPQDSWQTALVFCVVIAIFSARYYTVFALLLGGTFLYMMHYDNLDTPSKPTMTSSLYALNDLIVAGDVWNSVVHEAITVLENEERGIFYSPSSPTSPSSSLRVALHSSLHTTQTQCDNVRRLFSALTTPAELSQLSEMYAPPSPLKPAFSDLHDMPRPLSLPGSRKRTISIPEVKRSTWNGSYASLAHAGSPTMQVLKHREKRRSDIYSLLESSSPMRSTVSAPVSPSPSHVLPNLSGVLEEEPYDEIPTSSFGIAALDLQRKHTTSGLEAFGFPSLSSTRLGPPTMSSASRFTRMQTTKHPLSLSALHHALQGAIGSKRYACAHLLALRFHEEDDEGYWEDVHSVMALLTTTFADASSRLTDALEQAERQKLKDENPSTESLPSHSRTGSTNVTTEDTIGKTGSDSHRRMMAQMLSLLSSPSPSSSMSFAPMPNHLSRFAAHIDAISTALSDAWEHLEQCVASLHNDCTFPPPLPTLTPTPAASLQEAPSLRAYERLRRELGIALRECERGRERLLHMVAAARHQHQPADESGDPDDLPALGHDVGSDESDKQDSLTSPVPDHDQPDDDAVGFAIVPADGDGGEVHDDATSHLLWTASSQHLPPPGIEQVFESDSGGSVLFSRERSKLTREERIRQSKARRQSGGIRLPSDPPYVERWGPGGEVVQELKDVIWKVGERRRKLTDGVSSDGI